MTLTLGDGPLAFPGPQDVNYDIDGPKHRLLMHPFPRRVRAELGGETIFDSTRAQLVHESHLLPVLYVPREDVTGQLTRSEKVTHCPFKGDASHFHVGDAQDVAWRYEAPMDAAPWLDGLVAFYADRLDAWYDEDEPIYGHVRDPYHRTDVRRSSRRMTVTAGGEPVAESTNALVLSETGLPNRWYVPREDVTAALEPSGTARTHCPYKGDADYFDVAGVEDAAWGYVEPYDSVRPIAGHLSFMGDGIEVAAEGD
ncbi:MAG: DUF427 domain-containing protein [Solirubrobacteraceae bacterium]